MTALEVEISKRFFDKNQQKKTVKEFVLLVRSLELLHRLRLRLLHRQRRRHCRVALLTFCLTTSFVLRSSTEEKKAIRSDVFRHSIDLHRNQIE